MNGAAQGALAAPSLAGVLAGLPGLAFAFALVLARFGAALVLLPGLAETGVPAMVRAGFALALALLLTPVVAPLVPPVPQAGVLAAAMVLADVVTGLWIGWLARMVVLALAMAGQLLSYMIGLSSVLQPDPELGAQATAVSRLLGLAAPALLLASGLYAAPLMALVGSYRLVPPGALLPAPDAVPDVMAAFTQTFALALRLAAPFVLMGMIWQLAVGLVARFTPRVQMHFLSMPGQIVGGLLLLSLLVGAMLAVWDGAIRDAYSVLPGIADAARAGPRGR